MHEMHLMKNIIQKLEQVSRAHQAEKVVSLKVWLGALSHLTPEHFLEHFEYESKNTHVEGALVSFEISNDVEHPDSMEVKILEVEIL